MMRTAVRSLIPILALVVSACSLSVELHLLNNASSTVDVTYEGRTGMKTAVIEQGGSISFGSADFDIRIEKCTLSYTIRGVPPEDFIRVSGVYRHIRLQLQDDGRVFIVRTGDEMPVVAGGYSQPDGFPLEPSRVCDNS